VDGLLRGVLGAYQLKNQVALGNPLLDFERLLFAKRLTYNTSHMYTTGCVRLPTDCRYAFRP
jgi:hypothetical protein